MLGRRSELSAIDEARARGARLVTLVGSGGAGKTTLAEAHIARSRCTLAVDLSAAPEPLVALAEALGMRPGSVGAFQVAAALDARGVSEVLLDRADAVIEPLAGLLPTLLEGAPDAAWLVTSRARLGVAGEHVLVVGGLAEGDALALLRGRSPRDRGAAAEDALRAIVRATDALPLALQLAAARLAREPADGVAASLERHAPQGPVRAAIAAAIDALEPDAADALGVLAVFEDRFTPDACDAVVGVRAGASLVALRERGLVERARGDRGPWSRLHDEVRAVARARWRPGEADALRSRHAAWLARVAPSWAHDLHEGDAVPALRALAAHAPDLVAALEWASERDPASAARLALGLDAWLLARAPEGIHAAVLERGARAAARSGELALVVELGRVRARALFLRGRLAEARVACADAMHHARGAGDRRGTLAVSNVASAVAREMGDAAAARALASRAIEEARSLGDPLGELRARHNLACAVAASGDARAARTLYLECLAEARERRMRRIEALCLANLALVHEQLGELDLAEARTAQGIAAFSAQGDLLMRAKLTMHAARLALRTGALDEADRALASASADAERLGDRDVLLEAHLARAERALARGDRAQARAEADDAQALARLLRAGAALPEVERVLAAIAVAPSARASAQPELALGEDAAWFALRGGPRVDLSRRASLRRILAHLARRASEGAPSGAPVHELVAAGWPGERMSPESGAERVYTAIGTLRRLGLGSALRRDEVGYLLDAAIVLA